MSFENAMLASGLIPGAIVADGRWRRCKTTDKPRKRNGAYVLHPDGRGYFRNWALDPELNSWRDGSASIRLPSPEELAQREERKRQERARKIGAINSARAYWEKAQPLRGHKYLSDKQLSMVGCTGLRTDGAAILVPVFWGDRITSLQAIYEDGQKRFWAGAPVKGGAYVLDRAKAAVTAFCEGLATGLAIFQSVRNARVVVAFDAGNLVHVVERMKPTGSVVICGDNDHATMARRGFNPGIDKAANAAELIGAGVAWPEGIEGTDFADALLEFGQGGHKRIERQILAKARYVT